MAMVDSAKHSCLVAIVSRGLAEKCRSKISRKQTFGSAVFIQRRLQKSNRISSLSSPALPSSQKPANFHRLSLKTEGQRSIGRQSCSDNAGNCAIGTTTCHAASLRVRPWTLQFNTNIRLGRWRVPSRNSSNLLLKFELMWAASTFPIRGDGFLDLSSVLDVIQVDTCFVKRCRVLVVEER
ncbi:hypothetical protein IWZ03DRAFT_70072 [Phyllosticta citriasiana]|uniref:Uncharacterized protein n=1 Tax=Phyllosticta citriasiana TaxID=595635 RepID=A0ABR1KCM8_9PEZI